MPAIAKEIRERGVDENTATLISYDNIRPFASEDIMLGDRRPVFSKLDFILAQDTALGRAEVVEASFKILERRRDSHLEDPVSSSEITEQRAHNCNGVTPSPPARKRIITLKIKRNQKSSLPTTFTNSNFTSPSTPSIVNSSPRSEKPKTTKAAKPLTRGLEERQTESRKSPQHKKRREVDKLHIDGTFRLDPGKPRSQLTRSYRDEKGRVYEVAASLPRPDWAVDEEVAPPVLQDQQISRRALRAQNRHR